MELTQTHPAFQSLGFQVSVVGGGGKVVFFAQEPRVALSCPFSSNPTEQPFRSVLTETILLRRANLGLFDSS